MSPILTRGYSLVKDLKFLINNKNYSDLKIICQEGSLAYGNRAILAARSNVLDRLLSNGMKETTTNEIKFPEIKFSAMKIILEYLYTGELESESLTIDNCIETYHAADYFQLEQLQQTIVIYVKELLETCQNFDNHARSELAPKLLSKAVEKMSPNADNEMFTLLIEWVAKIPLEVIGFDELSFQALKCLLSQTYSTQGPFVTPEYTIFRHAVIQATHDISEKAIPIIESQLPIWNELNKIQEYSDNESDENLTSYEQIRPVIKEMLSTLLPFIDFRRIEINILADIIEPLQLLPTSRLLDAYRFQAREKKSLPHMRGIPLFEWNLQWEKNAKGSNLLLRENNSVVESIPGGVNTHQNVRANNLISGEGIFEWEVTIEETCMYAWVGVCTERGLDYNIFAGQQSCAWVLGSSGKCYHNNIGLHYVTEFSSGTKITVHLDMTERSIAFSINGTRHSSVSNWNNLPSKLYPIVSLNSPGRIRIGPARDWNYNNHQKNNRYLI